jgi:hypothetical protein
MTWGRLDDSFYDNPKVLAALEIDVASIALHARAIAYAARHEKDGHLTQHAVCSLMPSQPDRESAVAALTQTGLWHENGEGYVIHDFLDYNPSRAELVEKRRRDRERKKVSRER